ncbi:MAG: cbb3-type cytochrome c oxidase N-terminal domain-containing protein [Bacteroidales bacterium]|jgi:cytochrome c oxidase cbb3-type subunit 3|nr:cbb3-type cytochrome c oxidase N-terminal domain-containing protein [Bacteroidales bacterium]MDY0084718.1 cbb3-type cytochrome c oxidase N-terminal domain-containing protein [Bacteroidales bacterium]
MTTENKNQPMQDDQYEIDTLTNDKLIKNHSYDGIQELDNDLPPWWKWLFILSIVFAVVYLVRLWVFRADDLMQAKEFQNEMAAAGLVAAERNAATAAFEMVLLEDAGSLANGKETWDKICAVCHLVDGGGLVGPNMTDNYWIHGNKLEDLWAVVENGVLEKGMISYKGQLSEQQRLEVISYILVDLHGSTPATPKEPQGELYE